MILSILTFAFVCGIVPILLGSLYLERQKPATDKGILYSYAMGIFTMWGIFQIIVIPLLFMRKSLTTLTIVWSAIIICLCVLATIKGRNKILLDINLKTLFKNNISWSIIVAILLIAFQTYMLTVRMHTDADDAIYVAAATTTLDTNTILEYNSYTGELLKSLPSRYALSPFFVFTAMISKICDIRPTIIAHTLFPLMLIPLAYMIYTLLGKYFFKNKMKAVGVFLIAVSLIQMFSAFSVYPTGVFTLTRIWQGKAVLTGILLPAIFYFSFRTFEEVDNKKNWIGLTMIMLASCMVSSMGIALSAISLGILALIASIDKKNIKIICYSFLCCLPNIIYAMVYLLMQRGILY